MESEFPHIFSDPYRVLYCALSDKITATHNLLLKTVQVSNLITQFLYTFSSTGGKIAKILKYVTFYELHRDTSLIFDKIIF